MAKIKLPKGMKSKTKEMWAATVKAEKELAKKKAQKKKAATTALKGNVTKPKLRAVKAKVQRGQQESGMASEVGGKGARIAESVKGSLNTRPAFMRSLLKPSKGKGAAEGDARLQKLNAQIKGLEDKMKSKGKGGPSTPRIALMKLINQRMQLKKAMEETKLIEGARRYKQTLRGKMQDLTDKMKKAKTDKAKEKIRKEIEEIRVALDKLGNMGKQGGGRGGSPFVTIGGKKVDVRKISSRLAKGGLV